MRTEAFSDLATDYDRCRPRYPEELVDAMVAAAAPGGSRSPLFVDVGSGSGISTRQLRRASGRGPRILGLEPGWGMRREAVRNTPDGQRIRYVAAVAEALPLASGSADLVLAAQAVQWFSRPEFYREAATALRPGGVLALLENNRSWRDSAFLAAYEDLLELRSPGYSRHYRDHDYRAEVEDSGRFELLLARSVSWSLRLRPSDFLRASHTSTKVQAAIREHGEARIAAEIRDLLRRHGDRGEIEIPYRSVLLLFRSG